MMRRVFLFTAAITCLAQAPDIYIDVSTVTVGFIASDREGAPITDLHREDLTLLDDGQPREIQSFWRESSLPLTIGLIADVSGSQAASISGHRDALLQFLKQVLGPQDRAFVVSVAERTRLITDLTGSVDELESGVYQIGTKWAGRPFGEGCAAGSGFWSRVRGGPGCGTTVLWDAVHAAATLKMKPLSGRKALIVLSDGVDSGSRHNLTAAIEAAQSADTLVYTIRSVTSIHPYLLVRGLMSRTLKRLSDETGGRAFSAGDKSGDTFRMIEDQLRNLYVLGFTPPEEARSGKFRKLEIKVAKPGVNIRARRGYAIP